MGSWLRDVRALTLLYIAAGLSFAPWGVAYALAAVRGWRSPVLALILLAGGVLTALAVWNRLEYLQKKSRRNVQVVPATGEIVLVMLHGRVTTSGTVIMRVVRTTYLSPPAVRAETLEPIGSAARRARDQLSVLVLQH